ncbi:MULTISPECIES: hypothetical protein, partial [unclassified Mesorhizobium]|uniref:hypothetical protein n=1 Tax=unclassified Mesorhizobium TaxID=325217 RepID=UPI00301DFB1B
IELAALEHSILQNVRSSPCHSAGIQNVAAEPPDFLVGKRRAEPFCTITVRRGSARTPGRDASTPNLGCPLCPGNNNPNVNSFAYFLENPEPTNKLNSIAPRS